MHNHCKVVIRRNVLSAFILALAGPWGIVVAQALPQYEPAIHGQPAVRAQGQATDPPVHSPSAADVANEPRQPSDPADGDSSSSVSGNGSCGLGAPYCLPPTLGGGQCTPPPGMCIAKQFGESSAHALSRATATLGCGDVGPIEFQPGPGDQPGSTTCKKEDRIDYDFIEQNENSSGPGLNGIVPHEHGKVIGHSGVTVGYGVDFGGVSKSDLKSWGIKDDLIKILSPYLGLKGDDAADYLKKNPLALTRTQVDALDKGAMQEKVNGIKDRFNDKSKHDVDFFQLPANTQTALVDFYYWHGIGEHTYANLWREVHNLNWSTVARYITLEPGKPKSRLVVDSKKVKDDVAKGNFSTDGVPICET